MNNYWHTKYKVDQEGPVTFRYAARPHGSFDAVAASRVGAERSQPLLAAAGVDEAELGPLIALDGSAVVATSVRPSNDKQGIVVRLFNPTEARHLVAWRLASGVRAFRSDESGARGAPVERRFGLDAYEIVMVRLER